MIPGSPKASVLRGLQIELVPAARVSCAERTALLNAAYAGYYLPLHLTEAQLSHMDRVYDMDLSRSVVAYAGARPVGMASLARRGLRAWISSVAVLPEWRRRGIGTLMISHLVSAARQAGLSRLILEVIAQNGPARSLYAALGFCGSRELLTWRRDGDADPLPIPAERLAPVSPAEMLRRFAGLPRVAAPEQGWHDQPPSWQREPATLRNLAGDLRGYRLDRAGIAAAPVRDRHPAAYCLVNDSSEVVSLMDVGINPAEEASLVGRLLLQALAAAYRGQALSAVNVPVDAVLNRILAALGFRVTLRQYEMVLELNRSQKSEARILNSDY